MHASSSSHSVRGLREVEDGGLGLNEHLQGLFDAQAANATVAEALEGEMVGAASRRAVHLQSPTTLLKGRTPVVYVHWNASEFTEIG